MKSIISKDNPTFKQLKKLGESARERRKAGRTLLDGVHLLQAALQAGIVPELLVISESGLGHPEISALLTGCARLPMAVLPDALFAEISPVETPTGIVGVIGLPHLALPDAPVLGLLLEDIQDPGNLGAILRSAAAAGVQAVWLSTGCADAWSPKVLRAGMGAHFVLPLQERADLQAVCAAFHGQTLAACLQGESLYRLELSGPVAFMIGNEGAGLTAGLLQAASRRFTIPMPGRVESLNAAAAAAVCLFECVRQRAV